MPEENVAASPTSVTPTSVNPENPMSRKFPKWLVWVMAIILLLALTGGGYWLFSNKEATEQSSTPTTVTSTQTPTPTASASATPTVDPTASWTLYTNTTSGYSVKYPSESFVRRLCPDEELLLQIRTPTSKDDTKVAATCGRGGRFDVEVVTLKEPKEEPKTDETFTVTKSTVLVGGVSGRKYVSVLNPGVDCPCPAWATEVYVDYAGKTYLLAFGSKDKATLYDQILATFKFTN